MQQCFTVWLFLLYLQSISCHYATAKCYVLEELDPEQKVIKEEILSVAKRKYGEDLKFSFQVLSTLLYTLLGFLFSNILGNTDIQIDGKNLCFFNARIAFAIVAIINPLLQNVSFWEELYEIESEVCWISALCSFDSCIKSGMGFAFMFFLFLFFNFIYLFIYLLYFAFSIQDWVILKTYLFPPLIFIWYFYIWQTYYCMHIQCTPDISSYQGPKSHVDISKLL